MTLNAIVFSVSLCVFSVSSLIANATSVSNLTDLSREIGSSSSDLAINIDMDNDCKTHLKNFEKLRSSTIVFATDKDTIASYPAWPLVCSYAVTSDVVDVHDLGRGDRRIEFRRASEQQPYLSIVLQQITDDEQEGLEYQMVSMNNQQTTQYNRQKLVMNTMLDYYHHVVGE